MNVSSTSLMLTTPVQLDGSAPITQQTKDKPKGWFFTFGSDHYAGHTQLSHRYVVIPIPSWVDARARMVKHCGTSFAFQYPVSELKNQAHKFNLSPVGLSDISDNGGIKQYS